MHDQTQASHRHPDLREIREGGCYYVDKTGHARRLAKRGKHYCLSRPRRFGKSLFLDTLKELFEGNEALFRGLDVHDYWTWSVRHPALRLDFSGGDFSEPGYLHPNVMAQLSAICVEFKPETRNAVAFRGGDAGRGYRLEPT